jgi:hypothetical protein
VEARAGLMLVSLAVPLPVASLPPARIQAHRRQRRRGRVWGRRYSLAAPLSRRGLAAPPNGEVGTLPRHGARGWEGAAANGARRERT